MRGAPLLHRGSCDSARRTSPAVRTRLRWLCWFAAFVQIFAPLSGIVHHATVVHRYCFEHGVDEHSTAKGSITDAVDANSSTGCAAKTGPTDSRTKHEPSPHDRCDQPIQLHIAALTLDATELACVGSVSAPLERVVSRAARQPIPLLRLAPKTPPPSFL